MKTARTSKPPSIRAQHMFVRRDVAELQAFDGLSVIQNYDQVASIFGL